MKKYFKLFIALLIIGIVSCNSEKSVKETEINKIKDLETQIYNESTNSLNKKVVTNLLDAYSNYVKTFAEDSLAPEYLFKAGEIAMNSGMGNQSVFYFDKLRRNYPNYKKIPHCIFLQAFVYDSQLKNYDKAKEYYSLFLKKYPNHELAKDAKASIKNLGKSLDEIIKDFEKKDKDKK
ncbi:MAG: tetratricopeptide repeat protein [Bacteroidetes bacterium]|nr:tetratricopeptide repeat protein [Bacteroidota bacterium]